MMESIGISATALVNVPLLAMMRRSVMNQHSLAHFMMGGRLTASAPASTIVVKVRTKKSRSENITIGVANPVAMKTASGKAIVLLCRRRQNFTRSPVCKGTGGFNSRPSEARQLRR